MKLTKTELKVIISESVKTQLNEMSTVDERLGKIHIIRMETGASTYEIFEAMIEAMSDEEWKRIYSGLKKIYGYR